MATDKPQGNLAFGAALIHGLGLVALGIVVATHYALGPSNEYSLAIVAVAGATSGVAILWSLLLLWRAFSAGHRSIWNVAVFNAAMLEIAALCLLLWQVVQEPSSYRIINSAVWIGLPVFGPFLALVSMIAVPFAIRRGRKVNATEAELRIPERKRSGFRAGLITYAWIVVVSGVVLLPAPIFLLSASAAQFYDKETDEPISWGGWVAENTPDFIRDSVESFALERGKNSRFFGKTCGWMLRLGLVSEERLVQRLYDGYGGADFAWSGLKRKHPNNLNTEAEKIGTTHSRDKEGIFDDAATWLARHGSAEQIERILCAPSSKYNYQFRETFLLQLDPEKIPPTATPYLEELTQVFKFRKQAFHLLAWRASESDAKRIWHRMLTSERETRQEAARHMISCIQREIPEIVVEYLNAPELDTRGTAVLQLAVYRDGLRPHVFRNVQNTRYVAVTKRLCELLDDRDDVVKLSAMCVLSDIFREGEAPDVLAGATKKIQQYDVPSHQIKLDDAERAEIQAVRAAVEAFLSGAPRP